MIHINTEQRPEAYFPFGFTVSRQAWERLGMSSFIRARARAPGAASAPNQTLPAIRRLADVMNRQRAAQTAGAEPVYAGQLMALGLLEDVLRHLVDKYCFEQFPGALATALDWTRAHAGQSLAKESCQGFVTFFPPESVHAGRCTESEYLAAITGNQPNRCMAAREMILLKLTADNPALMPLRGLFDDGDLKHEAPYESLVASLETFFAAQPPLPSLSEALFTVLRAPMRACPDSIGGQLEYIKTHWAGVLPRELFERLVLTTGIMEEEMRLRVLGPGPARVLEFGRAYQLDLGYPEYAGFTSDRDWMANVVLIAKNVHVWFDQLSRHYQRPITRLDEIPDEELDRLARWGFTGLWLIGVWERSTASQKIKQIMGNPEAAASAYSLYDYVIAGEIGGEPAYENLRDRAGQRGIRLASDMVPNHVGIYSRWVVEHPERFIRVDQAPFPSYQFTGTDLSEDPHVGLFIEDGYWEHGDAAVVFKRTDKRTGEASYIYHGNDGTSMPWNDTAQLNFLLPEVREAVIQTILHVARKFPIIRFDAAMTLAKRHFQRLWFPQPGDAGAIPSRAEHAMARAEFDQAFPEEFWRELVNRVTREAPDTLLLAEAFWLMEGYFVRTLGMHRVYNSAFMNMLEMEENSKYRQTVKNVLEFSPAVLERFVNFMNNPDERTAVEQFGKGDKYYGVAVLMVTMPGLPMFGHGQIEGLTEKYGMEYRKAYRDEQVDEHMVHWHETEIFPLMRKRHLFSGAKNFALYDFTVPDGWVDENVFAYSNRCDGERTLILYNNAYNTTTGHIHTSTAINTGDAEAKTLVRKTLAEALALTSADNRYYVFRDHRTGLEYLRNARKLAEDGLHIQLSAYQYCAFLDFREIEDLDGLWGRLDATLAGNGVPSVDDAYQELVYAAVLEPFRALMNAETLRTLAEGPDPDAWAGIEKALGTFIEAAAGATGVEVDTRKAIQAVHSDLDALGQFRRRLTKAPVAPPIVDYLLERVPDEDDTRLSFWRVAVARAVFYRLGKVLPIVDSPSPERKGIPGQLLQRITVQAFIDLGADDWSANMDTRLVKLLIDYPALVSGSTRAIRAAALKRLFDDPNAQQYLQVNRYKGILWLRKEPMESLIYRLFFTTVVDLVGKPGFKHEVIAGLFANAQAVLETVESASYQVEAILEPLG